MITQEEFNDFVGVGIINPRCKSCKDRLICDIPNNHQWGNYRGYLTKKEVKIFHKKFLKNRKEIEENAIKKLRSEK